jgi:GYF domain 2
MSDTWHYADGDRQSGPVSREQLRIFLQSPRGGENALVWRQGLSEWRPAGELPELSSFFDPPALSQRAPLPPDSMAPRDTPITPETAPPKKQSIARQILGIGLSIVAALVGMAAVRFFGIANLMWPVVLIGITWFILVKCKVDPAAVPMLAVVIGHTGWMIVGFAVLHSRGALTAELLTGFVDVAIVLGLTIWVLVRRSRASAIGLLAYQCLALGSAILFSGEISIAGLSSQALTVAQLLHYLLRVIGIACCIYAIVKLGKSQPLAPAAHPSA